MYDVMIIGAGVTGSAIARELMRKKRNIAVLERCSDICEGTSKANSGIVHAGFDATPGTLKAKMNVQGSRMMEALSKELDFSYKRNGSLVLCFNEADRPKLELLLEKAEKNGVEGCEIISGDEVRQMEPQVSEQVVAALYAPAGGIVCPFGLTIALAENACTNGAEFLLNQEVQKIVKKDGYYEIHTQDHVYETKLVVNAAGVYADVFHNMVSEHKIQIIPRKGEYCLLDKKVGDFVSHTIFQLPTKYGKGVLVTPTVHGNLMLGPTAVDESDKENIATTAEGLEDLQQRALLSTPNLPKRQTITSFAGLRAHTEKNDFIIEEVADAPGFIDVAGIESPGLSSAKTGMENASAASTKAAEISGQVESSIEALPGQLSTALGSYMDVVNAAVADGNSKIAKANEQITATNDKLKNVQSVADQLTALSAKAAEDGTVQVPAETLKSLANTLSSAQGGASTVDSVSADTYTAKAAAVTKGINDQLSASQTSLNTAKAGLEKLLPD